MEYKQPQNAITIIHKRYPELLKDKSVELDRVNLTPTPKYLRNNEKVFMYTEMGIYDIVRKSNHPVADKYFEWVFTTIQSIKKNGFYIAFEKDEIWLGIRQETKQVRKNETDMIQKFVDYAISQGSTHAKTYYINLTNIANKRCGIESGERDKADQKTLLRLKSLETLIDMRLETLMNNNVPYKEVFADVKGIIEGI